MKKLLNNYLVLFLIYGGIYFIIECVYKHKITDWRMAVLGGCLGVMVGLLNNIFTYETDIFLQGFTGTCVVLLCEAIFGYQWNIIEGLGIWDYSRIPFSFIGGQINMLFAFAWFVLCEICIFLDDYLYYKMFDNTTLPYYKLFGKIIFRYKKGGK